MDADVPEARRLMEPAAAWYVSNVLIGAVQSTLVLLVAKFLFHVPMIGSLWLLSLGLLLFITANLAVGYTFSTIAQNQLQAMQMTVFFLLPSILLSGFAFPFRGMPVWAQWIGEILPATHFLRVVRGILGWKMHSVRELRDGAGFQHRLFCNRSNRQALRVALRVRWLAHYPAKGTALRPEYPTARLVGVD